MTDKEKEHWKREVERQYMVRLLRDSYMRGEGFGRNVMVKEILKMSKLNDWILFVLAILGACGVLYYTYKGVSCVH